MTTETRVPPAVTHSGPYKFLDYYLEKDKPKYAGRERDVREIVARATAGKSLVLYGRSGLGKTSLLLAGVFPMLRERGFQPVYVRTLESPVEDLRQELSKLAGSKSPDDDNGEANIVEILDRAGTARPIVLALDQFEEFFIRFAEEPEKREEFIATIGELTSHSRLGVRVIFSLREDYLANLDEFRTNIPQLLRNEYRLMPLTGFGARQAMTQPLIATQIPYDPALVSRMVDLLAEEDFDPVLLQIVCTEVYQQAALRNGKELYLRENDFESIADDLEGIFERYLNKALAGLPRERLLLVRAVLDSLITLDRTKRAVTENYFHDADFTAKPEEVSDVLSFLERARLVRAERRGRKVWFELAHDRVVEPALDWINRDREFFNYREARNLVLNAARSLWRENAKLLLTRPQLDEIVGPFEQRLRFNNEQTEMLVHSAIHSGSSHFTIWSSRLEQLSPGATNEALRTIINGPSETGRVGALIAIGRLGEDGLSWAGECLDLALEDESPEVRKAAGEALRTVGGPEEFSRLKEAFRTPNRVTRERARELASRIYEAPELRTRFGLIDRWKAARTYARRQRRTHREAIDARGRTGALSGLLSALAWTGTIYAGMLTVFFWMRPEIETSWPVFVSMRASIALALTLGLGAFLGWRLGRRSGIYAARGMEDAWYRVIACSPGVGTPLFVLTAVLMWGFSIDGMLIPDPAASWAPFLVGAIVYGLAIPLLASLIFLLGMGVAVKLTQPAIGRSRSIGQVWLWSGVSSVGLGLFVPAALYSTAYLLAIMLPGNEAFDVGGALALIVLFPIFSLVGFVASVSLGRAARIPVAVTEAPAAPPAVPRTRRLAAVVPCLLGLVVVAAWYTYFFGLDSIPLRPARSLPEPGTSLPHETSFGRGLPRVSYSRWKPPSEWPIIVEARASEGPFTLRIDRSRPKVRLVDSPITLAVAPVSGSFWRPTNPATLEIITREVPQLMEVSALSPGRSTLVRAQFRLAADQGASWKANLTGKLARNDANDERTVVRIRRFRRQPGLSELAGGARISADPQGSCEPTPTDSVGTARQRNGSEDWLIRVSADGSWSCRLELLPNSHLAVSNAPQMVDVLLRVDILKRGDASVLPRIIDSREGADSAESRQVESIFPEKSDTRIWWRWKAPESGDVTFMISNERGVLTLAHESGRTIRQTEDSFGEALEAQVDAGDEYLLSFASTLDNSSSNILQWRYGGWDEQPRYEEPPFEDVSDSATVNRTFSTPELLGDDAQGELKFDTTNAAASNENYLAGPSSWWLLKTDVLGRVTVSTDGSQLDTILTVVAEDGSIIAKNDDWADVTTSFVEFVTSPEREYRLGVGGYESSTGSGVLSWNVVPVQSIVDDASASNNDWETAREVVEHRYVFGSTLGADLQGGERLHGGQDVGGSVWWLWSSYFSGLVEIELIADESVEPLIAVYEGEDPFESRTIAANGPSQSGGKVYFEAQEGQVYYLAVAGQPGYYALRMQLAP